jgi:acetolactate synthase regulatory subunit
VVASSSHVRNTTVVFRVLKRVRARGFDATELSLVLEPVD